MFQKVHMLQHRSGIFGAEYDQINHVRSEPVFCDRNGIEWISHEDKALPQTVCKPVCVKGGDVCTVSCLYDHLRLHLFDSIRDYALCCNNTCDCVNTQKVAPSA